MKLLLFLFLITLSAGAKQAALTFPGTPGKAGNGKHIVFIAGDEEYRSEESCPMLAKILSKHHGFKTTVLFSINPEGHFIDPNAQKNIPGMDVLASADFVILGLRFRNLPDEQLQPLADYLLAGKPIFGFRTSTHGFRTKKNQLAGIDWSNFGPNILGEGWAGHYGRHGAQGCRGEINAAHAKHPILNGVADIFAESDVYGVRRVNEQNAEILVHGIVTESLSPSPDLKGKSPQPAIWLRKYKTPQGKEGTAVCSTMGSSCDLDNEGLRRLFINTAFHFTGLPVPPKADVSYVDPFEPSRFQFFKKADYFKKLNLKPADFQYGKSPMIGEKASVMIERNRKQWEQAKKNKSAKYAPIPGPKIISTITSVQQQQKSKERPKFYQPTPLKSKRRGAVSLPVTPARGESIVFLGNSLAERMLFYNHFEPLLHANFPAHNLTFRNMGFPGHTPAYRPEAGRDEPWAFPEGKKYRPDIRRHLGKGHYPSPDEWLTILQADTIVAFFGFNESFAEMEGLENFRKELAAFVDHTFAQGYNGTHAARLVIATPTQTEDPERNKLLAAYSEVIRNVAKRKKTPCLDLFKITNNWQGHTINGVHLNDQGYEKLSSKIFKNLFLTEPSKSPSPKLVEAVAEKNWFWRNDYRVVNGVHVYGGRWAPYGNVNYPEEIEKVRQLTVLGDQKIWATARDTKVDFPMTTRPLSKIKSNYRGRSKKSGSLTYLDEAEALSTITVPEGYQIETFATEKEFPNLGNPMQMQFDNQGRLWVSTMPSYPHYRPGDPKPNDKILIYQDTTGDGRADQEIVWADGLSIPIGFDFAGENQIYLTEGSRLVLLSDTDGDLRADKREYLLDGFDPHDSHHSFSTFETDNGGGLFMLEGRFLHSQVETPHGPQRMTDGGVWRFDHKTWLLERVCQFDLSNPWGIVHDEYGQNILNDASGGHHYWMGGMGIKMPHGAEMPKVGKFNYEYRVRPTSGSEIISSSHFPDDVQGDYLYGNTIGLRGLVQLKFENDGPALQGKFSQHLVESSDGNFRPADLEFAPDGSLYFLDWHNTLIGHMQHSSRDPNRSSKYGRIYRVTYPSRPLVTPPQIHGASIEQLFENLKLPELRTRKRSHRELRWRDPQAVIAYAKKFATAHEAIDRLLLEALWATWGHQKIPTNLLEKCLSAKDARVRAAAVRVVRHSLLTLEKPENYLLRAANDPEAKVRIEALTAASWLGGEMGAKILLNVASNDRGRWINNALNSALHLLKPEVNKLLKTESYAISDLDLLLKHRLPGKEVRQSSLTPSRRKKYASDKDFKKAYSEGLTVFKKEGSCATCHQPDGNGLKGVYPPLTKNEWVTGDVERLIKLTLHGLWGKIDVNGVIFDPQNGVPPMTAVGAMLTDQEVASVLTYVRNSWGNEGAPIEAKLVEKIREATKDRTTFYSAEELLKEHPFPQPEKKE